jgi:hypothetical protein
MEIHVHILSVVFLLSVEYLQAIPVALIMIIPPVGRLGITAIRYYHSNSIPHSILIASIVDGYRRQGVHTSAYPPPGERITDLLTQAFDL